MYVHVLSDVQHVYREEKALSLSSKIFSYSLVYNSFQVFIDGKMKENHIFLLESVGVEVVVHLLDKFLNYGIKCSKLQTSFIVLFSSK